MADRMSDVQIQLQKLQLEVNKLSALVALEPGQDVAVVSIQNTLNELVEILEARHGPPVSPPALLHHSEGEDNSEVVSPITVRKTILDKPTAERNERTSDSVRGRKRPRIEKEQQEHETQELITIVDGGPFPPSISLLEEISRSQYSSMAAWCATAQTALYKKNLDALRSGSEPCPIIQFHGQYKYDFAHEFYRVFKELGANATVPFAQSRVEVLVDIVVSLTTTQGLYHLLASLEDAEKPDLFNPLWQKPKIIEPSESVDKNLICTLLAHYNGGDKHRRLINPVIGALLQCFQACMWYARCSDSQAGLSTLVYALYPTVYPVSRGPEYRKIYSRLRRHFSSGKCLALLLQSDAHALPPGLVLLFTSSHRLRLSVGAAASRQFGISLSKWPGFVPWLELLTERVLLPLLSLKPMDEITKRLRFSLQQPLPELSYAIADDFLKTRSDSLSIVLVADQLQKLLTTPGCLNFTIDPAGQHTSESKDRQSWWPVKYSSLERNSGAVKGVYKVRILDGKKSPSE